MMCASLGGRECCEFLERCATTGNLRRKCPARVCYTYQLVFAGRQGMRRGVATCVSSLSLAQLLRPWNGRLCLSSIWPRVRSRLAVLLIRSWRSFKAVVEGVDQHGELAFATAEAQLAPRAS
jgi:hypothetical protein